MIVSTRGRYALRVLTDLAEHGEEERIPLKDVAERQAISQKYIESIMTLLSKNGFVDGVHGKGGGYKLNRAPEDYRVGDILRLTEGTLAPVACLECIVVLNRNDFVINFCIENIWNETCTDSLNLVSARNTC